MLQEEARDRQQGAFLPDLGKEDQRCGEAPPVADQRPPRPLQDRGRSDGTGCAERTVERHQVHPGGWPPRRPDGAGGRFREISIADTGVGIAPEDPDAVFGEFRQVGLSATKHEGTGLGLTLCRRFVELHGGRIWVSSQVGVGSTFTFTIPGRSGE